MHEKLATTSRTYIPNIYRPVLDIAAFKLIVDGGINQFGDAFIPVEPVKATHDLLTSREIDSLRQLPNSNTIAKDLLSVLFLTSSVQ